MHRSVSSILDALITGNFVFPCILGLALFGSIHVQLPGLLEKDGYFHLALSREIWRGYNGDFRWLPFSTYSGEIPDYHFLFHVLLAPFRAFGVPSGKVFCVLWSTIVFVSFYYLLRSLGSTCPFLWLLVYATSNSVVLLRMATCRANGLAVAFLLCCVSLLIAREKSLKELVLFLLSLLFTLSYIGAAHLLPVLGIFFLAYRRSGIYVSLRSVYTLLAGFVVGLLLHPRFPSNLSFFLWYLKNKAITPFDYYVVAEDYPMRTWEVVREFTIPLACFLCGVFFRSQGKAPNSPVSQPFVVVLALWFFVLFLRHNRMMDFWVPLAIAAGACPIEDLAISSMKRKIHRCVRRTLILACAVVGLLMAFAFRVVETIQTHAIYWPKPNVLRAGEWVREHADDGDLVFNINWGDRRAGAELPRDPRGLGACFAR